MQAFKPMYETLEFAYDKGRRVDISTEDNVFEDCDVCSLSDADVTDGMVDVFAWHPVLGCFSTIRLYFQQIREVVLLSS